MIIECVKTSLITWNKFEKAVINNNSNNNHVIFGEISNVDNKEKEIVFDKEITPDWMIEIGLLMIWTIVKESRGFIDFQKIVSPSKEDVEMSNRLKDILLDLRKFVGLRKGEMTVGIIILSRLFLNERNNENFHGSNYVDLIFYMVCCLLISHKISGDHNFGNVYWSRVGNLNLETVNACESNILSLLSFGVNICSEEYHEISRRLNCISCDRNYMKNDVNIFSLFTIG
jgi:hypothetical protein